MKPITAFQLIFTNVEADQSPRKRPGFQTLFYTREGLSEAEVLEVEARLFYVPKGEQSRKRLFFRTSGGKAVVAQIVPLAGADQFGRTGRYFAHALIFSSEGFQQLKNNPFVVLDQFAFWTTVEKALAEGDFTSGNIPPSELSLSPQEPSLLVDELVDSLEPSQLRILLLLSAQAPRLLAERRAISFLGPTEKMYDLLKALFELIPPPLRVQCHFDTYFVEGTLSRLPYWAVGLPASQPRSPNLFPFDLEQRRFGYEIPCQPEGSFERWLEWVCEQGSPASLARDSEPAYHLGEWFEGRLSDPQILPTVEPNLLYNFADQNKDSLKDRLRVRLKQQTGNALGERLFSHVISWIDQHGGKALHSLLQDFGASQLEEWVHQIYADSTQQPDPAELHDLQQFALKYQLSRLQLQCLRWAKEWKQLTEELRRASEDEFRGVAEWALMTVSWQSTWSIRSDEKGVLFGLQISGAEPKEIECRPLLFALLGVSKEQPPHPSLGEAPKSGSIIRKVRDILPSGKREEPVAKPVTQSRHDVNVERWHWLIDLLSKKVKGSEQG